MFRIPLVFFVTLVLSVSLSAEQYEPQKRYGEPNAAVLQTGKLKLKIIDSSKMKSTPARVRLRRADGTYIRPQNSLRVYDDKLPYALFKGGFERKAGQEELFYSPAEFETDIPTGSYNILIEKGFEYYPWEKDFEISPGQTIELDIRLSRWVDMPAEGWMSGDPHVHFARQEPNSSQRIIELLKAEDLKIVYLLMSIHRGKTNNLQPAFGKAGSVYSEGYSIHSGEEFINDSYGHLAFIDIPRLIEPIGTGPNRGAKTQADYPPDCNVEKEVKELRGTVIACHGGHGEFPVDLALGLLDGVEIMQGNKWEFWHKNEHLFAPHFYHALNCGFRITGTAGSDYPVLGEKILGNVRNYVHVGNDFSDEAWIKGLKSGKSFVTNGPMMLDFSINGKMMGDEIELDKPGETVKVSVGVRSLYPLDNLQILRNGIVIREIKNKKQEIPLKFEEQIPIHRSCWIAVRAQGKHPNPKRGYLLLHSNPIYIKVGKKPIIVEESVVWWLERIDELIDWTQNGALFDRPEDKKLTLEIFQKGRRYYEQLLVDSTR
jgi:hypothetical protein